MGEPKTKTPITNPDDVPLERAPSLEQRKVEALESVDLSLGEILAHVASIAKSLDRLASKHGAAEVHVLANRRLAQCPKGHGMQPTDDYCQTCYLDEHPEKAPKPRRPPTPAA